MYRRAHAFAIAVASIAGCTDSVDPPLDSLKDRPLDPAIELRISRVSGNAQEAPSGTELPTPFKVHVRNQAHGSVAGAYVSWIVEAGAGAFLPSSSTETSHDGTASVYFTTASAGAVIAAISGSDTARFKVFPPAVAVYGSEQRGYRFYTDSSLVAVYDGSRYTGDYSRTGSTLYLGVLGRAAIGTLYADSISVDFDWIAELDGFADGVFPLDRGASAGADRFLDGVTVRTDQVFGLVRGNAQESVPGIELPGPLVAWLSSSGTSAIWSLLDGSVRAPLLINVAGDVSWSPGGAQIAFI